MESDLRRFRRLTEGESIVVGRKTYESLPGRTLPGCKIYVLTSDSGYEVSDSQNHQTVTSLKQFEEIENDLYVSGGAEVYREFMQAPAALLPAVIVDGEYLGPVDSSIPGRPADITPCVEIMERHYRQLMPEAEQDGVVTRLLLRKGEFVEQLLLRKLMNLIPDPELKEK